MGIEDSARYLATLYLEDIADAITELVDPGFGFSRYQHHLATGPVRFGPIAQRLSETTVIDMLLDELIDQISGEIVCLDVPFPGTLYGALRIGKRIKRSGRTVWMGGGCVNTELREVKEPQLWSCVDALCYDDGEGPLLRAVQKIFRTACFLHRTRTAKNHFDGPGRTASFIACGQPGLGSVLVPAGH